MVREQLLKVVGIVAAIIFVLVASLQGYSVYMRYQKQFVKLSTVFANRISSMEAGNNDVYRLDRFIGFNDWDRVCIVKPYSDSEDVYGLCGVEHSPLGVDTDWEMLLINKDNIVKIITIDYFTADALGVEAVSCLKRDLSMFTIQSYRHAGSQRKAIYFSK